MDLPRIRRRALRRRLTLTLAGFAASLGLSLLSVALLVAEREAQSRDIRRAVEDRARYDAELLTLQLGVVWTAAAALVEHGATHPSPQAPNACGSRALAPPDSLAARLHWALDRVVPGGDPPDAARGAFGYDAASGTLAALGAATDAALRAQLTALARRLTPGDARGRSPTSVLWRGHDVGVWMWGGCAVGGGRGAVGVTFAREPLVGRVLSAKLAYGATDSAMPARLRTPLGAVSVRVTDALTGAVLFERGAGLHTGVVARYDAVDAERRGIEVRLGLSDSVTARLVARDRAPWHAAAAWGLLGLASLLGAATLVGARRTAAGLRAQQLFLSAVSHELRTPLTQMRLSVDLLRRALRDESDRAVRAVDVVERGTHQLARLVENLLVMAKADSPHWRVSRRPTELRAHVRTTIDVLAPVASNAGATVTLDPGEEVVAPVDPDRFQQVVSNLIENALKYGPAGQTVRVSLTRAGAWAELRVADEGPGVPPDERPRVWEPLERLTTGAHRAVDGVGLGLAVVRDVVEQHDGAVAIEDAPGGGACFVVALPTERTRSVGA